MEIIDDRHDRGYVILDRIVHNAIRLPLKGKSLREPDTDPGVGTSGDQGV